MSIKLKELLALKYGKRQIDVEDENGTIPIYGTGGVFGKANASLYSKPSILLGRKGTIDKPFWVDQPFWCVDTMFYSIIDDTKVIPKYLFYNLLNIDFSKYNEGTTIPSLRIETINNIDISLHSSKEQQHIVDILGTLDEKIENNLKKKEYILHLYSIEYKKLIDNFPKNETLSSIASIESGKRPAVKKEIKEDTFSIPIIGASSTMGFTNDFLYDEPILVIGRVGTHGIVQPIFNRSWPSDNTLVIKSKYYSFTFQVLTNIDYQAINKGSTQPLITQTDIKNARIALPDDDTLLKFETIHQMSILNEIDKENSKLNELKQLYLKKFFG